WPRFFTYFFAGSAFYLWRDAIPKSGLIAMAAIIAVALALRYGLAQYVMIFAGTYCVLYVALSIAAVSRIYGRRVDLSYGIYLFGFPIQQIIIARSAQSISPGWLFAFSLSATCFVAYLSWVLVEAPSLRRNWPTLISVRSKFLRKKRIDDETR